MDVNEGLKTIILVEDEEDIRVLYTDVLKDAGYRVVQAEDGEIALNYIKLFDWDLLLLDIMIPKVDGINVLKKARMESDYDNKPIYMLTNLGEESLVLTSFENGANGYLIKAEITPGSLVEEVKKIIG